MRVSRAILILAFFLLPWAGSAFAANLPLGLWSVGQIRAASSSGMAYCSMKNTYGSGHTLVFARDVAGVNSIAVDFGNKLFSPGAQYPVILELGMLSRQMTGVAATAGIMLVQMGKDAEFYDTLRKKDVLQVSFGTQSIGFGLQGSAEGLKNLDDCAAALAKGNVYVEKIGASSISPEQKQEMGIGRQSVENSLQAEIDKLRIENQRLLREKQKAESQLIAEESQVAEKPAPAKEAVQVKKKKEAPLKKDAPQEMPAVPAPVVEAPPPPEKKNTLQRLFDAATITPRLELGTYLWTSGDVYGAAEIQSLAQGQTINHGVAAYIDFAKQRCNGDFAYRLGEVERIGMTDTMQGEMACVDGKDDVTAAVLFIVEGNEMYVITQETTAEKVADALTVRDGLFSKLSDMLK